MIDLPGYLRFRAGAAARAEYRDPAGGYNPRPKAEGQFA
jgi:hypothetical protein